VAVDSPILLCCALTTVPKRWSFARRFCNLGAIASSGHTAIKTLEETSVAAVLMEYKQEGMDAEANCLPHPSINQRFPNLPMESPLWCGAWVHACEQGLPEVVDWWWRYGVCYRSEAERAGFGFKS
jgi:hypothetical protein